MKAGIVQAIHAVAALDDASGVEMLFTADEEVGSGASRALLEERAQACGNVLVLEPSADGGAVKTGRKGTGTFEIVVRGRASHAGLEPEKGVNSLIEASHQVLRIAEFGDPAAGTTVTPTVAKAGTADNVVPAETRIKVDVRVTNAGEQDRIEQLMSALSPVDPHASVEAVGGINRPPMPESASARLFPLARGGETRHLWRGGRWGQRRQLHRRPRCADARRAGCRRRWGSRRPRIRDRRHDAGPGRTARRNPEEAAVNVREDLSEAHRDASGRTVRRR